MAGVIKNIIAYTNTTNTDRYAKMFETNGKPDEVAVISDGVSDMSGRKTDVVMVYTGANGKRTAKHFDLSLKVGSIGQFGQGGSSGKTDTMETSFEKLSSFFKDLGVDISAIKENFLNAPNKMRGFVMAYNEAAKQFKSELEGSNADQEKNFLKKFIYGLQTHGTRNDPNVKLLQFEEGQFYLLDFKKLDKLLHQDKIDLDARMDLGKTRNNLPIPVITIYNNINNQPFMTIRAKQESSGYIRNYVEKGPGLKALTVVRQGKAS